MIVPTIASSSLRQMKKQTEPARRTRPRKAANCSSVLGGEVSPRCNAALRRTRDTNSAASRFTGGRKYTRSPRTTTLIKHLGCRKRVLIAIGCCCCCNYKYELYGGRLIRKLVDDR